MQTVEKRPREMILRREFVSAMEYLNHILPEENHLEFVHWDFHKFAKSKPANVLAILDAIASDALDMTGFYCNGKPAIVRKKATQLSQTSYRSPNSDTQNSVLAPDREPETNRHPRKDDNDGACYQSGILRTNCIDCLDRTNVAQYAYGLAALGRQLYAMGFTNVPKVDPDSSMAAALMDMYQCMGDALAQQYGGSAAHNTVFQEIQGRWKAATQSREFLKSIKRYYSNAYTDGEKQDAINLFLGYFKPQDGKPALWELDSDYYLHVCGIEDEPDPVRSEHQDAEPVERSNTIFKPIPACKEDFTRLKYTSFKKLIKNTCGAVKTVRLSAEPNMEAGISAIAPDAVEVLLKTPNWLFGKRKLEEGGPDTEAPLLGNASTMSQYESYAHGFDLSWLSFSGDLHEEEIFTRYLTFTSVNEANGWFGGTLLYDQEVNSQIYKHYGELCEGPGKEILLKDPEKERRYSDALLMGLDSRDDAVVEAEMKAAFEEYEKIGSDLEAIPSSELFSKDTCLLTRWMIGEEKLQVKA